MDSYLISWNELIREFCENMSYLENIFENLRYLGKKNTTNFISLKTYLKCPNNLETCILIKLKYL